MAVTNIIQILEWFKTGKKPTQAQFWATWGSFWHKHEGVLVKHPTESEIEVGLKTLEVVTLGGNIKIPCSDGYLGSMKNLAESKADLFNGKVPEAQLPTFLTNKWKKEQLSGFIYEINIANNELSYYELYFVKDDRSKDFSDPNFEVTNNSITINSGFPLDGVVCFYRKIELNNLKTKKNGKTKSIQ